MTTIYKITHLTATGNSFTAMITFDPADPVFAGHFPEKPIVPGVVLVEITADLVSQLTGKELVVKEVSVIKFLQAINPLQHPSVTINGSVVEEGDGRFKVDLAFSAESIIFAKLRGIRMETL